MSLSSTLVAFCCYRADNSNVKWKLTSLNSVNFPVKMSPANCLRNLCLYKSIRVLVSMASYCYDFWSLNEKYVINVLYNLFYMYQFRFLFSRRCAAEWDCLFAFCFSLWRTGFNKVTIGHCPPSGPSWAHTCNNYHHATVEGSTRVLASHLFVPSAPL